MKIEIRKAERQDVPLLLEFIKGIARYEKMENEVIASADVLEREMFDEHKGSGDGSLIHFNESENRPPILTKVTLRLH